DATEPPEHKKYSISVFDCRPRSNGEDCILLLEGQSNDRGQFELQIPYAKEILWIWVLFRSQDDLMDAQQYRLIPKRQGQARPMFVQFKPPFVADPIDVPKFRLVDSNSVPIPGVKLRFSGYYNILV